MRFKIREISLLRLIKAVRRRIANIPSRLSFGYSSRGMKNRKALRGFKDKYKGETCVLLANGPSLSKEDLSVTEQYTTFGLNRIYLGIEKMGVQLDYLVCVNQLVLEQFAQDFDEVSCQKFMAWNARKHFKKSKNNLWLHKGLSSGKFSPNMSKGLNPAATVTYAALQVIYYMGFKKVIILGMDHNFTLDKSKIPNTKETYTHTKDVNHFIENYFPKGVKWETPDLISTEYFYQVARARFEADGRQIYDCTTGGKCEVFVKTTVDQAING